MKTTYRDYTILTEAANHPAGGWSLALEIFGPDGRRLLEGVTLEPEMTFATEALAHCAGISLARHWIDART